jgi:methylase of polypeptide subunit release factors
MRLSFWKTIEHRHIKPALRRMRPYRTATYAGLRVAYKAHLDGGGSTFGQDFLPVLQGRGMPKAARAFEWCSGPGFIGFSLLAHGLTETLCLADINPEAVAAARKTVADNRLESRVAVHHSDNLKDIPPSEQWDLVVSNPPHFGDVGFRQWRYDDPDWRVHRDFFGSIASHLKPGGVVVLQENNDGSTPETFATMIKEAGLKMVFEQGASSVRTTDSRMFYLGIMRADDTVPKWADG